MFVARIDDPDVFAQLLAETRLLRRRFAHTAPRPWDAVTASAELSVHLGHLARCLLRYHDSPTNEWDDPARPLSDIGDELADVLLGILGISAFTDVERGDIDSGLADLLSVLRLDIGMAAGSRSVSLFGSRAWVTSSSPISWRPIVGLGHVITWGGSGSGQYWWFEELDRLAPGRWRWP